MTSRFPRITRLPACDHSVICSLISGVWSVWNSTERKWVEAPDLQLHADDSSDADGLFNSSDDEENSRGVQKLQNPVTGNQRVEKKKKSALNFSSSDDESEYEDTGVEAAHTHVDEHDEEDEDL